MTSIVNQFINSLPDKRNALALLQAFSKIAGNAVVAAAGSSQATAAALTAAVNAVTAADGTKAVRLPIPNAGDPGVWVINTDPTSDLKIYPAVGGQINALGANAVATLGAGESAFFTPVTAILWYGSLAGPTATELGFLDGAAAANSTASKASIINTDGTLLLPGAVNATAGAGFTGGTGTIFKTAVEKVGGIIRTSILFDLTGLASSTTDLDIIGTGVTAAHMGQLTAALNGTILSGRLTCLEVPAGGVTDIDLYWATEATGKFDDAISGLTETALITAGGAWTLALTKAVADPVGIANGYLYLTGGAGGTASTYTAGKFLLELQGY